MRRTQSIPRTRSREKMQTQLGQALERTAGWESLARCTLGLHHTHRDADKGAAECGGSISDQLTVFSRGAFVMVYKG